LGDILIQGGFEVRESVIDRIGTALRKKGRAIELDKFCRNAWSKLNKRSRG